MAFTTQIKNFINRRLQFANIQLETCTAERAEAERFGRLQKLGRFDGPAYPLLPGIDKTDLSWVRSASKEFGEGLAALMDESNEGVSGFDPSNTSFSGSDAQLLYLMVRTHKPEKVIEVGSGNSTRIVSAAILDGGLNTQHIAIDPEPRVEIEDVVDQLVRARLEELEFSVLEEIADSLGSGDILFIDSSHELRAGGDLAVLFCRLLPRLKHGVIVHFHDIFLPFEYPRDFFQSCPAWGEQYILQSWMAGSQNEILWPGYLVQKERADEFASLNLATGRAQSFWVRIGTA